MERYDVKVLRVDCCFSEETTRKIGAAEYGTVVQAFREVFCNI
jgi:hypothetical protein